MMRKGIVDMADVMDYLTTERKFVVTAKPTVLKRDICWDVLVSEDLKCPYCNDETGDCIIDDSSIIAYVLGNYLLVELFEPHDLDIVFSNINYCPMCGRPLK